MKTKHITIYLILLIFVLLGCSQDKEVIEVDRSPQVFIKTPIYGMNFHEKDLPLIMEGSAQSADGDKAELITWSSDKDGQLGKGRKIVKKLSIGSHNITAEVPFGQETRKHTIPIVVHKNVKVAVKNTDSAIVKIADRDGATLIIDRTKKVITDTSTGLMWQKNPEYSQFTFKEALEYAKNSTLGGYTDWRIPNIGELVDIHNLYYDGREAILHNEFITFQGEFWSCSPSDASRGQSNYVIGQKDDTGGVRMSLLSVKGAADIRSHLHVRLVRDAR